MDRITLWGCGGGVSILHGYKRCLSMPSTGHMGSLCVCLLLVPTDRSQCLLCLQSHGHTYRCLHTEAPKYPPQSPHHLMWCVQMHIHTLPGMHICPFEDLCACPALFCFYLP